MAKVDCQWSNEERAQRATLTEPIAFAHAAYSAIVGSVFDMVLCRDVPAATWELQDRATRLLEEAFARNDGEAFTQALNELSDARNNAMTTAHSNGMELGAIFEQLRQSLCQHLPSLERGPNDNEREDIARVAELRTAMLRRDPIERQVAA